MSRIGPYDAGARYRHGNGLTVTVFAFRFASYMNGEVLVRHDGSGKMEWIPTVRLQRWTRIDGSAKGAAEAMGFVWRDAVPDTERSG